MENKEVPQYKSTINTDIKYHYADVVSIKIDIQEMNITFAKETLENISKQLGDKTFIDLLTQLGATYNKKHSLLENMVKRIENIDDILVVKKLTEDLKSELRELKFPLKNS